MASASEALPLSLLERILARLGISSVPDPTKAALDGIYEAWCRQVPFDNVRKLIHVRQQDASPLPGDDSVDFFEAWLKHGTGGTCWATNGAMFRLLASLDFDVVRGEGTMVIAPNIPPNHGTVIVRLDGQRYIVDGSLLQVEPLRLDEEHVTEVVNPAWGVRCAKQDGHWVIRWRPAHQPDGLDCRIDSLQVTRERFHERHEATRPWSPFNYELYARSVRGSSLVSTCFGHRVEFTGDGQLLKRPVTDRERRAFLIEELGMSEEIVSQLPADVPTPPPPWSKTAQQRASIR